MRGFTALLCLLALLGALIPLASATDPGCHGQLGTAHVCVYDREFSGGCPNDRYGGEETAVIVWVVAAGASVDGARWCWDSRSGDVNGHGLYAHAGAFVVGGVMVVWNEYETPEESCYFAVEYSVVGQGERREPGCPTSPPDGPWGSVIP